MKNFKLYSLILLLISSLGASESQLSYAAMVGDLTTVKSLTNGDIRDAQGRTPLYVASCYGHTDIVEHMLSIGYDINAIDLTGASALMCAIWNNQVEVAKYLINRGADINVKNRWGNTALKQARFKGLKKVDGVLVMKGAVE